MILKVLIIEIVQKKDKKGKSFIPKQWSWIVENNLSVIFQAPKGQLSIRVTPVFFLTTNIIFYIFDAKFKWMKLG